MEYNKKKVRTMNMNHVLIIFAVFMLILGMVSYNYFISSDIATAKGKVLYNANCSLCHGLEGKGVIDPKTRTFRALPLDESAHAWYHNNDELLDFILNGSPLNPKMIAWKSKLSEDDARAIVMYIKSLWSPEIRDCQGANHMRCM
jgi:mono/diheme cytochrome c family protein